MPTTRKIKNVYHFTNGMVIVFDQHGNQMPEFGGPADEAIPKIRAAGFAEEIPYGSWNVGRAPQSDPGNPLYLENNPRWRR